MTTLQLVGSLITTTSPINFGHLQIVNFTTGEEIEVQSWINPAPGDPDNFPYFQYRLVQSHSENTNDVPGTPNADPANYASINLDFGARDANSVWQVLETINQFFYDNQPAFGYALLQNSNSYANTLLWMVGIDTASYMALATPTAVSSFPGSDHNILENNSSGPIFSFNLNLTTGDDFLRTGDGNDILASLAGDDTLVGGAGNDLLIGGSGNDALYGGTGRDTLIGDSGSDTMDGGQDSGLFGGESVDTVDYSGLAQGSMSVASDGILISLGTTAVVSVEDSFGGVDILLNFEKVLGTAFDDTLKVSGTLEAVSTATHLTTLAVDGGASSGLGDTVDLSGVTGAGVDVFMDPDGRMLVTQGGGNLEDGLSVINFENIIGSNNGDTIDGNGLANIISGGAGVDQIEGGAGSDTIFFGAEDSAVFGGKGYDVSYLGKWVHSTNGADGSATFTPASTAISINMQTTQLEAFISGSGNDTISTDGSTTTLLAGGVGDDTFNIDTSGNSPTVVWGGDGADTINLTGGTYGPAGILVVHAEGLTAENFHLFDLESLGLGKTFDWSEIDAVVVNPDSTDHIQIAGEDIGVWNETYEIENPIRDALGNVTYTEPVYSREYLSGGYGQIAADYKVSFLGGTVTQVFAAAAYFTQIVVPEYEDPVLAAQYDAWWKQFLNLDDADFVGAPSYEFLEQAGREYFFNLGNVVAFPNGP